MTGLQPTIATGRSAVAQAQSRPPRTWRRSQSAGRPTWRYRTGNPERLPALSSLPPPRALIGREAAGRPGSMSLSVISPAPGLRVPIRRRSPPFSPAAPPGSPRRPRLTEPFCPCPVGVTTRRRAARLALDQVGSMARMSFRPARLPAALAAFTLLTLPVGADISRYPGTSGCQSAATAAADGALHVAVPPGGALRTGPVDAPDRCSPCLAVGRPDARCEVRAVAAAGELLGHPVPLDVVLGPAGRAAEVADETADHRLPPFGLAAARPRPRLLALKEAHQHPGPTGRR